MASGFESLGDRFDQHLAKDPDYSAQLAVRWRDRTVVDIWGRYLSERSTTGVYSATRRTAAIVIGALLDAGMLELDEPVRSCWPEFSNAGKRHVTVRQLRTHQSGLINSRQGPTAVRFYDSRGVAATLPNSLALWRWARHLATTR